MTTVSFLLNLLIFILTVLALYMMISGSAGDKVLSGKGLKAFRYFTVDSNVLMGLVALLYALQLLPELRSSCDFQASRWVILVKLTATSAVALTMFTVLVFLGPTCKDGYLSMFKGGNFFFHLIIPLLGILDFVFFVPKGQLRFADTVYGLIPTLLYGAAYTVNVLKHAENGRVSGKYDWYGFVRGGIKFTLPAILIVFAGSYLLTVLLWLCI